MFQFKEITAKLSNVNIRAEIHGEETKLAADLAIELRGPNTILDKIAPGLLQCSIASPRKAKTSSRNSTSIPIACQSWRSRYSCSP